ncbi:phosphate ABC transporter ATP-binding protein PstB [Pullulanibacillus sp. KACC 23026]|uniref:phosphate ABC transporter ATP-binding protein PstB n=1 Tax=Pullulanibacillus sp. KACC 23026 TaxID=3028315 RepID=UPI0023AF1174|nr:phosphate ABC transporter ATP-binding protein PstB [Pullulanibacillus sp. KACC 23026]WEG14266.1 phosphate ABC transporter ATP-binding protein PstB [Pullulanibacillus sp. KACC 23026]
MESSNDTVFDVIDFNLWYGKTRALKNINLKINEKEVTAIIGPSGCGKSTFLKSLNLMNSNTPGIGKSGQILYHNSDINHSSTDLVKLRKEVGMVFQKPLPFAMSLFDNVTFGPKLSGVKSKKALAEIVETSLKSVGLWDEVKDRLHDSAMGLSGGQQQRLCTARAIATKPEVLLMDEPTSALDPISAAKMEELMLELKEDYTIVVVTHNLQQAARTSDKTAFFLMGELIEISETTKMFSNPEDQRTDDYLSGRFG